MPLPGLLDLLDILVVAGFVWLAIGALRSTRARNGMLGLALVVGVYLAASALTLRLTTTLLQAFFTAAVIILAVVFQEDLRRFFERLGAWRPGSRPAPAQGSALDDLLARVVTRLASQRTGALIVLPGKEPLDRHLQGGVPMRGVASEPALLSLFDASSPGHDGAVVIVDGVIDRFAVHLPLSTHHEALGAGGTRHAAALGLAERCDATVIVVSEERGTVSIARDGALRILDRPEDVAGELADLTAGRESDETLPVSRWRDPAIALGVASALWLAVVPGGDEREERLLVPVTFTNLPNEVRIESITPPELTVTLRGQRRDLLLLDDRDVAIEIDGYLARLGRRTFEVTEAEIRKPASLDVIALEPSSVRLSLEAPDDAATASP